jgi:hypothetical protein
VNLNTSVLNRLIYFDQLVKFGIEAFRERSGRWSRVLDKNRLELEISKVDGTMEQPVQSTNT